MKAELTIVTFKEGEQYVAQALERDFAAQGSTIAEALEALSGLLEADEFVRKSFEGAPVQAAPRQYYDMLPRCD